MTYYDYLCNAVDQLVSLVEDLHYDEACTRFEGDDDIARADALAAEADRLDAISDSIWDKACRAALYAA